MSPVVQTMFNTISLDDEGGGTSTPSTPTSLDLKFVLMTGSASSTLNNCGSGGIRNGGTDQPSDNNSSKKTTSKFIETCYDRLPSAIRLGSDRKKKPKMVGKKNSTATISSNTSTPSMTIDEDDGDVPICGDDSGAGGRRPKLTISIDEEPYSGLAKLNNSVRTDGDDRNWRSNSYGYHYFNNGNRREMIDYDSGYGASPQQQQQQKRAGVVLNSRRTSTSLRMRQVDHANEGGGSERSAEKRRNDTTKLKRDNGGVYTTSRGVRYGGDTFASSTSDEEEEDQFGRTPTAWSPPLPKQQSTATITDVTTPSIIVGVESSQPSGCFSDHAVTADNSIPSNRRVSETIGKQPEAVVFPISYPTVKSLSANDVFTYDAISSTYNHRHQLTMAPPLKSPIESSVSLVALDVAALDRTLPTTTNGVESPSTRFYTATMMATNGGGAGTAVSWSSISIPSSPTAGLDFRQHSRLQSSASMALCESTLADEMREAMRKYKGTPNLDLRAPDRVFKVVFVGDSGVGKTCFLHQFCHNRFKPLFNATIGVDFTVKTISVRDRLIAVQLWDTAGQERFRSITKQYFRKADGVVLMYDVTSEQSYLNVRNWIESVRTGVDDECVMCLVGNKVDLYPNEDCRTVTYKHGRQLADEFDMLFFETSAFTGSGIHESMRALAERLQQREEEHLEEAMKLERMGTPDSHSFCFCF